MIQLLSDNKRDSSKLKDYQRCPRHFFYRHVLGWESDSLSNHLVFGTSWHLAMEHLLLNGYNDNSVIKAFDAFLSDYRKTFSSETDEMFSPKTPDNAFLVLAKYADYPAYRNELDDWEVLWTEIAGSVAITEKDQLYFRMDSILKNRKTAKTKSFEHKTGSRTWMWDEQWPLSTQIGTYNHVLFSLFPYEEVSGVELNGSFFIKRKKDPYEFHRLLIKKEHDQMQVWLDTVRYYFWEIEREYHLLEECTENEPTMRCFPLRDNNCIDYSRLCEYHDYCMAWPNPLRRCQEPPIGFHVKFWDPTEREAKKTLKVEKKEYKENII